MVTLTFKKGDPTVFVYKEDGSRLVLVEAFHPTVVRSGGTAKFHKRPVEPIGYAVASALAGKTFNQAWKITRHLHWPRPVRETPLPGTEPGSIMEMADLNGDASEMPWIGR